MRRIATGAAAGVLLLAACSKPSIEEDRQTGAAGQEAAAAKGRDAAPEEIAEVAAPVPTGNADAGGPLVPKGAPPEGGDGSPIILSPLSPVDIDNARLEGELSCAFESDPESVLLIASGNVKSRSAARGIVKVGDDVEPVAVRDGGGFDAMLDGATFVGQGKTIRVALGKAVGGGAAESPRRRATLTYQRADGATRTLPGLWTCGP